MIRIWRASSHDEGRRGGCRLRALSVLGTCRQSVRINVNTMDKRQARRTCSGSLSSRCVPSLSKRIVCTARPQIMSHVNTSCRMVALSLSMVSDAPTGCKTGASSIPSPRVWRGIDVAQRWPPPQLLPPSLSALPPNHPAHDVQISILAASKKVGQRARTRPDYTLKGSPLSSACCAVLAFINPIFLPTFLTLSPFAITFL